MNVFGDVAQNDDAPLMEKLVCNARRLAVTLDLTACADVTDDALEFAAKSCTSLQSLTLDGCAKLTDAALFAVAKKTPNATLLSLQGCGRVTNAGLEPLCGSCRHLMALNLSYCGGVNNATLGLVARFLRDLELFHVAFCTDISDSGARPRGTLRADFNGSVLERSGPDSSAALRELDESTRLVEKSAESTSM